MVEVDKVKEGWIWIQGSCKWYYYCEKWVICGGMLLFVYLSEGYELGNNDSKDNCVVCKCCIVKEVVDQGSC